MIWDFYLISPAHLKADFANITVMTSLMMAAATIVPDTMEASVESKLTTSARYGPKAMPAISQPRIEGSFNFVIILPQVWATHIIAKI